MRLKSARQFSFRSKCTRKFLSALNALDSISARMRSNPLLIRLSCARNSLIRNVFSEHAKKLYWINFFQNSFSSGQGVVQMISTLYDQNQLLLKPFMIRPSCAWIRLWSDSSALESAYDQTQVCSFHHPAPIIWSAKRSGVLIPQPGNLSSSVLISRLSLPRVESCISK